MSKSHSALSARQPPATYDDTSAKLEYLQHMLSELARVAQTTNSPTLVYLLEMAALEAEDCARVHQFKTGLQG